MRPRSLWRATASMPEVAVATTLDRISTFEGVWALPQVLQTAAAEAGRRRPSATRHTVRMDHQHQLSAVSRACYW